MELSENLSEFDQFKNEISLQSVESINSTGLAMSEINFALGLPFSERITKGKESKPKPSIVRVSNEKTNNILKIEASSSRGALGSRTYDVLNALLHIASVQIQREEPTDLDNYRIFFSAADICEILKLDSAKFGGRILEHINELVDFRLGITGHIFNIQTKETQNKIENIPLIRKYEEDVRTGSKTSRAVRAIIFDPFVSKLLNKGFSVNMNRYLSLKIGKERRAYIFLIGKKGIFGKTTTFNSDELSSVLGDLNKRKDNKKANIEAVLSAVKDKLPGFDFAIKSIRGKEYFEIFVEFGEAELDKIESSDPMYNEFMEYYTKQGLDEIGFFEAGYSQLKGDLEKRISKKGESLNYYFFEQEVNAADLIIDLALFQIIKTGYTGCSYLKLASKYIFNSFIEGCLDYPQGFDHFILKRNEIKRKADQEKRINEEIRKRNEEEKIREIQADKNFEEFFNTYIKDNKSWMNALEKLALAEVEKEDAEKGELSDLHGDMKKVIMDKMIESKIYKLAKEDYTNIGPLFNKYHIKSAREVRIADIKKLEKTPPNLLN